MVLPLVEHKLVVGEDLDDFLLKRRHEFQGVELL